MTSAAKSVKYFGYYLILLSVALIAFPNLLLSTFGLPETSEPWIRVVGVLVLNIGLLYVFMAPEESTLFFALSAYARAFVLVWFALFVVIGWAGPTLILFGLVDAAGAAWTFLALRKSAS